jgi:cell division protein FtsQ
VTPKNVKRSRAEAPSLAPTEQPILPKKGKREKKEKTPKTGPKAESRFVTIARTVIGVMLVVGIGGGVAWGARRYVKTSPRFAVNEIATSGGKHRSPEELAAIAGIAKGQNVFSVDLDRAKARLVADPWIADAHLSRQLPATIFLRVTEREAAGLVATQDGTYLVTRDGMIIKRIEPGDPTDVVVVTGVTVQQIVDDREGTARSVKRALELAGDYASSPLAQRAQLEEVHVEPSGELTLIVGKTGIVLRMGQAPYRKKLDQAVRVVAELDRRGAKADTIMIDDEARENRVVVRVR